MRQENEKVFNRLSCRAGVLCRQKTHPHWETRTCRNCDKKNATRQAIENFWPCRVSALILKFSCRVVRDKTRILVSSADQPLGKVNQNAEKLSRKIE